MAIFGEEVEQQLYFSQAEYEQRLDKLRQLMAERDLDACLISAPEGPWS